MKIKLNKCVTCTKSVQYLSKLLINGALVPCVEVGKSFRYLGRSFQLNMSNRQHMMPEMSLTMSAKQKKSFWPIRM